MAKLKWERTKTLNSTPKDLRRSQIIKKAKRDYRWSTYRDGEFYIGKRLVPRYDPRKTKVEIGLVFNSLNGRFEIWKDAGCLGSMSWKVGQPALIQWATNLGGLG